MVKAGSEYLSELQSLLLTHSSSHQPVLKSREGGGGGQGSGACSVGFGGIVFIHEFLSLDLWFNTLPTVQLFTFTWC